LLIQNALPAQKEGVLRASTGLFVRWPAGFFLATGAIRSMGLLTAASSTATAGASLLVSCDISTGAATDSSLAQLPVALLWGQSKQALPESDLWFLRI